MANMQCGSLEAFQDRGLRDYFLKIKAHCQLENVRRSFLAPKRKFVLYRYSISYLNCKICILNLEPFRVLNFERYEFHESSLRIVIYENSLSEYNDYT